MTASCYIDYLDFGHQACIKLGLICAARYILANICCFVSWKRGPDCWVKIAPTILYLLNLTNYIIIPLVMGFFFAQNWQIVNTSVYGIYMQCVCILWVFQALFYFRIIKPYIYDNATAYIASRKLAQEKKAL